MSRSGEQLNGPRRLGRPPGSDGEDTIRRIMQVAEHQFGSLGYSATTNKTIAHDCDLTQGAIFYHCGTKIELYRAVSRNVFPLMLETYRLALIGVEGLQAQISAIMEASIELHRSRPSMAGFVMNGPVEARRHAELQEIVEENFSALENFMAELMEEAKQTGGLAQDIKPESLVDMLLCMLHGLAHLASRTDSPERVEDAARSFERLSSGTLNSPLPRPSRHADAQAGGS